ncbi:MAG: PAS domain-containing protein [Anaerolineae bacterium]|nr:PAS domain-containing protein [Anaerolineae bacterium]
MDATKPHPLVKDTNAQLNVRLLASLTLIALPLHVLSALALFAVYGPHIMTGKVVLLSALATLLVYYLSRTRYVETAINLLIVELIALAVAMLYINQDSASAITAVLPIYAASMFRSQKRVIITAVITLVGCFAVSQLVPGNWSELMGVLTLLVITTIVILIRTNMLLRTEAQLRRRNQQLAESEARFRAAIDAGFGIFYLLKSVYDAAGGVEDFVVVDVNVRALDISHFSYEQMIGKPISPMLPEAFRQPLLDYCHQVVKTRLPIQNEVLMVREVWWELQIVPVGEDSIAVSAEDVTARKNAEARQIQLQVERERFRLLRKFVSDVSHDVMTPLSIINTSTYLAGKVTQRDEQELHLGRIEEQTVRLKEMFGEMLNHSRLDQLTPGDLEFKPIDLHELLRQVITTFEPMAHKKSQQLVFQPCDQPVWLAIDETRLRVALSNLVDNAIRYTDHAGTVFVSCLSETSMITIEVKDEGPGIPLSSLPYIFDEFYRVEEHRPQNAGTGLGLSISRKIVELHGGTIEARNRSSGGMSFRVHLPVRSPDSVRQ